MPQLLDRPQISTLPAIPTDLIEQEALRILNVSIDDLETRCDHVIPQGDVHYLVSRGSQSIGHIFTFGDRFDTPFSSLGTYSSLFAAATSFLGRGEVNSAYRLAHAALIDRFATTPDYF
jgi:hypothetical protein